MVTQTQRVGVLAGEALLGWQRDAVDRLADAGATVVRLAAQAPGEPAATCHAQRIAATACAAFARVAWDAPAAPPGERPGVVLQFAPNAHAHAAAEEACVLEVVLGDEPVGFTAVERGAPTLTLRVDRLHPGARRTTVVRAVVACDGTSYARTLRRVARVAAELPRRALARLAEDAADADDAAEPVRVRVPSGARVARLRARCALRRVRAALARVATTDRWSIGRMTTPLAAVVEGAVPQIAWLPLPRGRFWADPFPYPHDGTVDLLCEGYDYAIDRGYLTRVPFSADGTPGAPLTLRGAGSRHLSYPYVLADGPARFVVPEQSEARRVALYTLDGTALREEAVLLEGVAAVDPTPFRHDGRWWMFLTDRDRDDNGELLLYCADALRGPWSPHPLNPIVSDIRCARPAGTPFVVDGTLYRPGQDCSTGYGSRVAIARVDVLTPHAYRETVVAHVAPRGARGTCGVHTLGVCGDTIFVDGKDAVFDAAASLAVLRSYARKLRDLRPALGDARAPRSSAPLRSRL